MTLPEYPLSTRRLCEDYVEQYHKLNGYIMGFGGSINDPSPSIVTVKKSHYLDNHLMYEFTDSYNTKEMMKRKINNFKNKYMNKDKIIHYIHLNKGGCEVTETKVIGIRTYKGKLFFVLKPLNLNR